MFYLMTGQHRARSYFQIRPERVAMKIMGEAGVWVPAYSSRPDQPGLYLALFHGRSDPQEQMSDWGFDGPLIGPILWFHTTYALELKVQFATSDVERLYFSEVRYPEQAYLPLVDHMVLYNEMYYGDWTAYIFGPRGNEATEMDPT